MALVQKLSLRRKTAETQAPAEAPVAAEEISDTASEETQKPVKRLITKKAAPIKVDEEIVDVVPEPVVVSTPAKKIVTHVAEPDEDHSGAETAVVSFQPMAMGRIDGAISERDLMRPRVNMVQSNSSDLESKGFTVGQIVLNGEILVWEKGYDPVNMILMTGRKKFIQRLNDEEYKDGIIPMIFDTPKDAENAGFSVNWDGKEPPTADPGLFCLFLLEQPEYIEPDPIFSLEHAERKFCLAEMKFTGVNYRSATAARWLMTQSQTSLIPDSRAFMLGLTCNREKQKSGNIVTVASFKNLGRHKDPGFTQWVLSLG
jgi:hypothetical protein